MFRKIVHFPNPVLKKKSKAVKRITPEIVRLIADMIQTMRAAPGVGLAAPQIGESIRVIAADIEDQLIVVVNPKIVKKEGEQTFTEGCLSLPGIEAPVCRAKKIVLRGLNKCGEKIEIKADGLLATVLQHEIDHLDGKVFIDRVKDPGTIKHLSIDQEKKEELI